MFRVAALVLACVFAGTTFANAAHVRAELVPDRTAATPGEPLTIAVVLDVDPGWHVYWTNPGDTGAAPKLKWTLPPGVTAGPLRFPTPGRIDAGDGLTAFGYHDRVTLLTTLQVPAGAAGTLELTGTLSCVVCREACVSERHAVSLKLPVGKGGPANADRFAAWTAAVPTPAQGNLAVTLAADGKAGWLDYPLADGEAGKDFFPPAADNLEYDRPVMATAGSRRVYRLPFKVAAGTVPADIGTAVVVVTLADGAVVSREVRYGGVRPEQSLTKE